MSGPLLQPRGGGTGERSSLAAYIEELANQMVDVAEASGDPALQELVGAVPEVFAQACSALREEPEGSAACAGRELDAVLTDFGASIQGFGESAEEIAAGVQAHVQQLDRLEALPPDRECVVQFRGVAAGIQEAAASLDGTLSAIAAEVRDTTERLDEIQAGLTTMPDPGRVDPDTQLNSRAAFDERLSRAVAAGLSRGPWGLLLVYVDRLEDTREQFGPLVGDALLFKTARVVEDHLRQACPNAFLARFATAAVCCIAPADEASAAAGMAERLCERVGAARWQTRHNDDMTVVETTVSVGLTAFRPGDSAAALTLRAEEAMRAAVERGGNTVEAR